jgi:hypothetical protein
MKSVKEFAAEMQAAAEEQIKTAAEAAAERTVAKVKAMGFSDPQIAIGKSGAHFKAGSRMLSRAVNARDIGGINDACEQMTAAFLCAVEIASVAHGMSPDQFMTVVTSIHEASISESKKLAAMLAGDDAPTLH